MRKAAPEINVRFCDTYSGKRPDSRVDFNNQQTGYETGVVDER
jgi:hypothetical protein